MGFGVHRPSSLLYSDDLGKRWGKDGDWVRARTGMNSRTIAAEDESLSDMAIGAARGAVEASGLAPGQIDLIIVASCSTAPPRGSADVVAAAIGATGAAGTDLNAACAGFCYSLAVAADSVRMGSAQHVLVVGAERMSTFVDPDDLPTAIVFGDGAGAVVVGPSDDPGIGPVVWGSDGAQKDLITIETNQIMTMQGQAVFRWATSEIHPVALEACRRAGVPVEELAAIVPHQANLRIVDHLARKIDAPKAVVARDGADTGNTSAASIPLALHRLIDEGQLLSGDLALLVGFGAGLTYAAQVVRLP
ncbi:beta-ketoacyl-ACP synthase 3 [Pseudonocardia spinosispora]|uniref:beta-ketoacyl-ACP synthase 3 n=1 Tax=Pseudonocardia spinosispora TaxID=103441 RepID=UPI000A0044EB|nr:beta-ketoacyl-ACP synthase 3 [Pseudonocardia spinosispora]